MDEVEELIGQLESWQRAYPLSAFPEPDLERARELLEAGGMTLDSVSASNMRHVVSKIVPPVLKALTISPERLRNAARALDKTAWRARDTKRDSVAYGRRRKASLRSVRAVAIALGLKVG